MANKVSGQRLQLVHHQWDSQVLPINAEIPLVESSMAQEILTRSSCIEKVRGTVTLLAKFSYQDLTFYFYRDNGIVRVFKDTGYFINNGFANRMKTDFKDLEVGVEYDLSDENENFMKMYPSQYNPVSQTVAYGSNVITAISTVRANALDAVDVSETFARKFASLRDKTVNINLTKKRIISSYENIFPPLGEFIDDVLAFKVVKDDNTVASLAQNADVSAGYEDDNIIFEKNTFINRIEVFCNRVIEDPILEKYRQELLKFRQDVYSFIVGLDEPYDDFVDNLRGNYMHIHNQNGMQEVKDPMITLYTKTVSIAETESKFTNLNGGKITIKDIYADGKYKDELGNNIDMLYPANSLINRSISGALYEVHLNSVGMFIDMAVRENRITPEKLYMSLAEMFESIGKLDVLYNSGLTPIEMFNAINLVGMHWKIDPYDLAITVQTMDKFTAVAERDFGYRKLKLYTNDIEVSDLHVVGRMFMMRLYHDRYHITAGSSIPRRDSRGHIIEKTTTKKDGRSLYGDKPTKICVQTMDKLLKTLSNEAMHVLIREKDPLFGTHELSESVGFKFESTKKILNRKEYIEEEIE